MTKIICIKSKKSILKRKAVLILKQKNTFRNALKTAIQKVFGTSGGNRTLTSLQKSRFYRDASISSLIAVLDLRLFK